jgi:hypothetical protein
LRRSLISTFEHDLTRVFFQASTLQQRSQRHTSPCGIADGAEFPLGSCQLWDQKAPTIPCALQSGDPRLGWQVSQCLVAQSTRTPNRTIDAQVVRGEIALAHLKTTMRMEVLHGKTVPGVLQEVTVFAIVDNLVRMVMWPSATLPDIGVERISVLDALRWLGAPSTGTPLGALIVNPTRPRRVEPRVKKRRPTPSR